MSTWPTPAAPPQGIWRCCCAAKQKFAKAFRQLPFLIPISWQCTNDQPTKGIYQKLAALEGEAVPTLSFAPGFPAADFAHCGPSVFAYGRTQADADAAADDIAALIESHEDDFDGRIYTPDEGVRHAMELAKTASKPIVIADTQDNPGAGGDSDTTGMLRALVRNNATRAAIGVIYDPAIGKGRACRRRRRHRHAGARRQIGHSGRCALSRRRFIVEQLSDGKFVAPGPYYGGRDMDMGPSAACGSAASGWSSARTRRSSRTRRCIAMSASSRPSRPSSSTRARCISAPTSNRSPKSF